MSRIGRKPIEIPKEVKVQVNDHHIVDVVGPLGKLEKDFHPSINVKLFDNKILIERKSDSKFHKSLHGLTRSLIANMIEGVVKGYQKTLQIEGIGFRASVEGKKLILNVGFTGPSEVILPEGIEAKVEKQTIITISGYDKEAVGEFAAKVRAIRKPEPYKGTGIRYLGEHIRRKVGKAATTAGKGKI